MAVRASYSDSVANILIDHDALQLEPAPLAIRLRCTIASRNRVVTTVAIQQGSTS